MNRYFSVKNQTNNQNDESHIETNLLRDKLNDLEWRIKAFKLKKSKQSNQ